MQSLRHHAKVRLMLIPGHGGIDLDRSLRGSLASSSHEAAWGRTMARRIDHASWDQLFVRTAANGRPLQARLREMVISAISDGWLATDMPLPSSRQLARNLGIARNTLSLAYQQLIDEDVLEPRERISYFVKSVGSDCPAVERPNKETGADAIHGASRLAARSMARASSARMPSAMPSPAPGEPSPMRIGKPPTSGSLAILASRSGSFAAPARTACALRRKAAISSRSRMAKSPRSGPFASSDSLSPPDPSSQGPFIVACKDNDDA